MLHERTPAGGPRRVILDAGRGNALGPELLGALERAFDPSRAEPGPVLLGARGRSFCTGLDLVAAVEADRDAMGNLMDAFHRALRAVLLWPAPVVAAIQGHALAGGALLALCADRRIMAHGDGRFGIHGVQLGVVYPQVAIEVVRWKVGARQAEELLYGGELRSGHWALQEGFVDELVDPEGLEERATELCTVPVGAKDAVLRPVAERLARVDPAARDAWLDRWFDPATRRRVLAARDALRERKGLRPGERRD